jgi:xylulokinase
LTGGYAIDCADASGTSLFDITQRNWSETILEQLAVDPDWLPSVFEGPQITGELTAEAAEKIGLPAGIPVIAGGGDQAAQAVGVGAIQEGIIALTLGTSGVVFAPTGHPYIDPQGRLHAMCHSLPPGKDQGWHLMGVMLSAGGSLRWYRDTLEPDMDYASLIAPTVDIPPGSEGLVFLPYLTGERTPYPDPLARGGFIGFTLRHQRDHLTRAVLEGVAFGLRDSMELVKQAGLTGIEQVRISGGGARSPIWRQILADVINAELVTVNTTEGACFGAALLAGVGTGSWDTVQDACQATVRTLAPTQPIPSNVRAYKAFYQEYRALYPALKDSFKALSLKSST